MGRYANSIGIWDFEVAEIRQDLHPTMKDVRAFRELMVDPIYDKNRKLKFNKFSDFMYELIERENPDGDTAQTEDEMNKSKIEIREFVEINLNELFEEALIAFKWTTKEKLEEVKKQETKKLMSSD